MSRPCFAIAPQTVAVHRSQFHIINPRMIHSVKYLRRIIAHRANKPAWRRKESSSIMQMKSPHCTIACVRIFKRTNQVKHMPHTFCASDFPPPLFFRRCFLNQLFFFSFFLAASHTSPQLQVVRVSRNHPEVHYIVKQGENLVLESYIVSPLPRLNDRFLSFPSRPSVRWSSLD